MTCHELRDALVDHARGALNGVGSRAAIESHLEHCHACATEFARQRALTEGLRAVARASAHEAAPAALEDRLMSAFASQHAAQQPAAPAIRRRLSPWLAAAASIAIVGGVSYAVMNRVKTEGTEGHGDGGGPAKAGHYGGERRGPAEAGGHGGGPAEAGRYEGQPASGGRARLQRRGPG